MGLSHNHIIQKQVFEISSAALKQAQYWEREAGELVHTLITPCLEATFNRLAGSTDVHFIIDRLELDLGIFPSAQFKSDLKSRLQESLEKALLPYLQPKQSQSMPSYIDRAIAGDSHEANLTTNMLTGQGHLLNAFIFFLEKGRLPWWVTTADFNFENIIPEELSASQLARLKDVLVVSSIAKKRFVSTLSPELLERWFIQFGIKEKIFLTWNWLVAQMKSHQRLIRGFHYHWNLAWLEFVVKNSRSKPKLEEIIRTATGNDKANQREIILSIWKFRKNEKGTLPSSTPFFIQETLKHWRSDPPAWLQEIINPENRHKTKEVKTGNNQDTVVEAEIQKEPVPNNRSDNPEATDIYTSCAGLVLLHPFLVAFLKECGLMPNPDFQSDEDRSQAVRLFSFLATGEEGLPEYQLLLPKLLCNMAWETPLLPVPPFTEKEKTICNELLQAVINHWKALRNTTPDGLRGAFLQREGKLCPRNNGWLLEVERRPQDVLFSKLPWGVSLIKLPWMTGFLHVSWT